jgi:hypothetical protein
MQKSDIFHCSSLRGIFLARIGTAKKQHTISSIGLVNKYLRHDLSNRPLPFFAQAQSRGVRAHP